MSYAQGSYAGRTGSGGAARGRPLLQASGDQDALARAQAEIQKMQEHVKEIVKQTQLLGSPSTNAVLLTEETGVKVDMLVRAATNVEQSARDIIRTIVADDDLKKQKLQKIRESLDKSKADIQREKAEYQRRVEQLKAQTRTSRPSDAPQTRPSMIEADSPQTRPSMVASSPKTPLSDPIWRPAAPTRGDSNADMTELCDSNPPSGRGVRDHQTLDVVHAETDMHADIAKEFAQDVGRVQEDMSQLNQAMAAMAEMVNDQGHQFDNIEANMDQAHTQAEGGTEQLVMAERSQSSSIKRLRWALIVAVFFLIVLVICFLVARS